MSEKDVSSSFTIEQSGPSTYRPGAVAAPQKDSDAAPGPLLAFAGCRVVNLGNNLSLVISSLSGRQQLIANDVLGALMSCTQYDTIAGHAQRIGELRPDLAARSGVIATTLSQLAQAGILTQGGHRLEQLEKGEPSTRAPTRVAVLTADRPAMLERLLESLLESSGLTAFSDLLVIDDSRNPANSNANRDLVERFNLRSAKSVIYVGPEAQQALLRSLKSALPADAHAAVDFLFTQSPWGEAPTYGRNRNLALLLSVGFRVLCLDDDILCRAIASPDQRASLRLGNAADRRAVFYADREAMLQDAVLLGESPLQLHAEVLGRSLVEINTHLQGVDLHGCEAALALQFSGSSRILVSQCGSWGDPGAADPHWALRLDRGSLELLASSGVNMGKLLESRACWFGCSGPTILKNSFMSQLTGLDNTALLPPYFPAFRAEDQLFGSMLNALHPHSAVFEFPWGVPHLPPTNRGEGALRRPIPSSPGLGIVARLIDAQVDYTSQESPQARLQGVAGHLRRLAAYSPGDLECEFRTMQAVVHSDFTQHLEQLKTATGELPAPNWQAYLDRAIEEMSVALQTPLTLRAIAPRSDLDRDALHGQIVGVAESFADALSAWPEIRAAAGDAWNGLLEHRRS